MMCQDLDKRIKSSLRRYKQIIDKEDLDSRRALSKEFYVHFNRPPLTTATEEALEIVLYRKPIAVGWDDVRYSKGRRGQLR